MRNSFVRMLSGSHGRLHLMVCGLLLVGLLPGGSFAGDLTTPNVFVNGEVADADEVNANFGAVETAVDDNDGRVDTLEAIPGQSCPAGEAVSAGVTRIPARSSGRAIFISFSGPLGRGSGLRHQEPASRSERGARAPIAIRCRRLRFGRQARPLRRFGSVSPIPGCAFRHREPRAARVASDR